jgi:hypothetical protein
LFSAAWLRRHLRLIVDRIDKHASAVSERMPEKAEANGRFTPSGIPIKDFYGPEDVN